ncbi:MAG: DHH family phosphoesterase [Lachnospiraceae bacterium]|jgi:phosphoesterase RecJ-like protein|nr:DHH family phosphoesterase [Lachnospiraceae bacterium]MCI1327890.1 DHH family phosphoesterase [Lachnospiraceae bacterium]
MEKIAAYLEEVKKIAIAGHVNPDGDCIGSCMGMYLYLTENYPELDVDVFLEEPKEVFSFLKDFDKIRTGHEENASYDLMILLDISSRDRVGVVGDLIDSAGKVLCLDHHRTNEGAYTWFYNDPEASSTAEVVYRFLDPEKISEKCAEALYMGIAHDTGIFQYQNCSPETMCVAAELMKKGIPHSWIIDRTYYQKTYEENQILGRALIESFLFFGGKVIVSVVRERTMQFFGVTPKDMDGIVSQLRNTIGVEVAVFLYETDWLEYKVSMRSKDYVDVSRVAAVFGGGGHARAAGCTIQGMHRDVINAIAKELDLQFREHDEAVKRQEKNDEEDG